MAIGTYAELQTAVANWLNRSDLTSRITEFIALAQARFNRDIRVPQMLARSDSFTIDSQYESVPTGFLEAKRFLLNGTPPVSLEYVSQEEMAKLRAGTTLLSGKPLYYSFANDVFEFWPTPETGYTGALLYYTALDLTTTNWLLTSHPDICLHGSLVEAEPYVMNDERVPLWKSRVDEGLRSLKLSGERRDIGTPVSIRPRSFG